MEHLQPFHQRMLDPYEGRTVDATLGQVPSGRDRELSPVKSGPGRNEKPKLGVGPPYVLNAS